MHFVGSWFSSGSDAAVLANNMPNAEIAERKQAVMVHFIEDIRPF